MNKPSRKLHYFLLCEGAYIGNTRHPVDSCCESRTKGLPGEHLNRIHIPQMGNQSLSRSYSDRAMAVQLGLALIDAFSAILLDDLYGMGRCSPCSSRPPTWYSRLPRVL
jgi:hypothetical protein